MVLNLHSIYAFLRSLIRPPDIHDLHIQNLSYHIIFHIAECTNVVQAFSDTEKPFLFSDLAALKSLKPPNQKIKRLFNVRKGAD